MIRKATAEDLNAIADLYERIHDEEEAGRLHVGWKRSVYPRRQTVSDALTRGDLFAEQEGECIVAAAVINQIQVPEYHAASWTIQVPPKQVMVLHTLAVHPDHCGHGYAKAFVRYYEAYAESRGCTCLRMDTQELNTAARALYAALGYGEVGVVDSVFNGIPNVRLVCLEKSIEQLV